MGACRHYTGHCIERIDMNDYHYKLGYCEDAQTYCSEAEKNYKRGADASLDKLVERLEQIDDCEFASFTLCLVKEIVQDLKGE